MSEQIIFREKTLNLLQNVTSDFQDAVVYFPGILPKLESVVFESINYINETVFNLCAGTNGMYFMSHNSFAFNHKLRGCFGKIKYIPIGKAEDN